MNKIAIITAVCGQNHIRQDFKLKDPTKVFNGVDYIAFVEKQYDCKIWKQIPMVDFSSDEKYKNRRNAKIYKVLPNLFLPEYDYWIWVDSNFQIIMDPNKIISDYMGDFELGLWSHRDRKCVYTEAIAVNNLSFDYKKVVDDQVSFYKSQNYPENNGLFGLGVNQR